MRLDRPIGWWLLLIPGLWGLALGYSQNQDLQKLIILSVLFFMGAILMRGAGCIINDIWDRDLDQKVERTKKRPIASGAISIKNALIFLFALLLLSLLILMQMSLATIVIGLSSIVLVILYPLMKRITFWPQAFLGITFNIGVLMGYAAMTGSLGLEAFILYIAAIFWTLGYDTIYALQDKDDDALAGIKSTALLFGDKVKTFVSAFYAKTTFYIFLVLIFSSSNYLLLLFLLLPVFHFAWQVKTLDLNDQSNALKIFQSNRVTGLLFFIVILAIAAYG